MSSDNYITSDAIKRQLKITASTFWFNQIRNLTISEHYSFLNGLSTGEIIMTNEILKIGC